MFPLFSILRREKRFSTQPHQFVLLHLKRLHLMEWVSLWPCAPSMCTLDPVRLQSTTAGVPAVAQAAAGPEQHG